MWVVEKLSLTIKFQLINVKGTVKIGKMTIW
jgi:hypothetical protein